MGFMLQDLKKIPLGKLNCGLEVKLFSQYIKEQKHPGLKKMSLQQSPSAAGGFDLKIRCDNSYVRDAEEEHPMSKPMLTDIALLIGMIIWVSMYNFIRDGGC